MEHVLQRYGTDVTCPVAVIVKDGQILMGLRNYQPDKWKKISVWTIPGGRCDEGETIEETLRREVKEEIGIGNFILKNISVRTRARKMMIRSRCFCVGLMRSLRIWNRISLVNGSGSGMRIGQIISSTRMWKSY